MTAEGSPEGFAIFVPAELEAHLREQCTTGGMTVEQLQTELSDRFGRPVPLFAAEMLHTQFSQPLPSEE